MLGKGKGGGRDKSFSWRVEKPQNQGHSSVEFIKREPIRLGGISTKARQRSGSSGLSLVILATECLLWGTWHPPTGWGKRQHA